MNWPQIPESFEGMDSAALRALADSINAARVANLPNLTADDEAEYDRFTALERRIRVLAVDTAEAERAAADAEAAEQARLAAEEAARLAAEQGNTDAETGDGGDDDGDGSGDGDGGGEGASDQGGRQLATVGGGSAPIPTGMGTGAQRMSSPDRQAARWTSTGAAENGPLKGQNFASNLELARAIQDMNDVVDIGSDKKHRIAKMTASFAPEFILDPDKPWTAIQNLAYATPDEIEAAFCPPATPIYDLACEVSTRRPVLTGLPGFRTPERGRFTVLASPTMSSITTGHGQWTIDDDADPEAIKTCQTISCVNPSTFEIYAIYRCLTVKNLMMMTFPELVAAYLNRLQGVSAREAEILLLEAMNTGSDPIDAPALGYNGTTSLLSSILTYIGLYQDIERWDTSVFDAWMPRWVLWAIKTDLLKRRRTDGGRNMVASDEEINAMFRDAGVEPHWFMDRPTWAIAFRDLEDGGVLNFFPDHVDVNLHKRGKFAVMTRGELSIGVTGNNMYRQDDDLLKNQFTFFIENYEGLIDTDSCPAHTMRVPACWSGVQIADDVIACDGSGDFTPSTGA